MRPTSAEPSEHPYVSIRPAVPRTPGRQAKLREAVIAIMDATARCVDPPAKLPAAEDRTQGRPNPERKYEANP